MQQVVIATHNLGKVEEFKSLMNELGLEFTCLSDYPPIPEPEENGRTFAANARIKAKYYAKETGKLCLADDSGLEVLSLKGAPGVRSARYAGEEATDADCTGHCCGCGQDGHGAGDCPGAAGSRGYSEGSCGTGGTELERLRQIFA